MFRSKFLLDQDAAVRSANLALIYEDAGLSDVAVREATKRGRGRLRQLFRPSVPFRNLRRAAGPEEGATALPDAVGGRIADGQPAGPGRRGRASQNISQQEYSKMFEADRLGVSSQTEFYLAAARGWRTPRNSARWTISPIRWTPIITPTRDAARTMISKTRISPRLKYQIHPKDTVFLELERTETTSGDNQQYYNDYAQFDPQHPQPRDGGPEHCRSAITVWGRGTTLCSLSQSAGHLHAC